MKSSTVAGVVNVLLATATIASKFTLKTVSAKAEFNDLCVGAYHTGAGTADAVMFKCLASTKKLFYQKGHEIIFTGYGSEIVAGVQYTNGEDTYDTWGPVTVNSGNGTEGFAYTNARGFTQTGSGVGFIICEWAHNGLPQLFALAEASPMIPSSCGHVKLVRGS